MGKKKNERAAKVISFLKYYRKIFMPVILIVILLVIVVSVRSCHKKSTVSSEYLLSTIQKASDLVTAKITYTGMTEYEEGNGAIPFINKGGFKMVYDATANVGIDVKEVEIEVDDSKKTIHLTLPRAKAIECHIDSGTIKYFDEKFRILNFNDKEIANEAQDLAEEEALKKVQSMGILEMADQQSEALIKGLLSSACEDYTFTETTYKES